MEYHSALKRKSILARALTQMDAEDTLGEISPPQKDDYCDYCVILFVRGAQTAQIERGWDSEYWGVTV